MENLSKEKQEVITDKIFKSNNSELNRNKQIDEIAKILCGMKNGCDGCMWDKSICYERNDAEEIYNAGYRKASDVAREIFEELKKAGITEQRYPVIAEVRKKYTEEGK
jgi:hypothetical protein